MFNAESFGDTIPNNWEEIADFLNGIARERGIEDSTAEMNDLWEQYWNGEIPGAPEAEEEEEEKEKTEIKTVYRVYWSTAEIHIDKRNGINGPEDLTESMIQDALLNDPNPNLAGEFETEEEAVALLNKRWPIISIDHVMGMGVKYIPVTGAWVAEAEVETDEDGEVIDQMESGTCGFSAMPEPEEDEDEQNPEEAFSHLYSDYDIWSMARSFYDGGYRDGDEEDLMILFRSQRDENNEQGNYWNHTEETDKLLAERLCEEFRKIEADHKAAAEEEAVTEIEYHGRIIEVRPVRYKYNDDRVQDGVLIHDTADEYGNGDAIYGNGWKFDDIHDVEDLVSLFCETPNTAFERMPDGIYKITE